MALQNVSSTGGNCGILDRGVERGRSRRSRDYLKPQRACVQAYLQISTITT